MKKPVTLFLGCLVVAILFLSAIILLFIIMAGDIILNYNIPLAISNEKQEKWLLVFLPFIGEELRAAYKINFPPLKHIITEENSYRQYVIITGALKWDAVNLHFRRRIPYDKFFLLVLGWKIDPSIESLDLGDLASHFETEPDYQKFLFNPDYTGKPELDDYKSFAYIDLQ